jgi:hypothetical protein
MGHKPLAFDINERKIRSASLQKFVYFFIQAFPESYKIDKDNSDYKKFW